MSEQFVVDTSALIQAYVEDDSSAHVKAMIAGLLHESPLELHVLDLTLVEAANVLWKRVVLHKRMTAELAEKALANLRGLPIMVHESNPLLNDALRLGIDHQLAVYDVLVVALAQELDFPLITADSRQEAIARHVGLTIKPIADFASSS